MGLVQDKDLLPLVDALASLLPKFNECSHQIQTPAAFMFEKAMKLATLQLNLKQASVSPVPEGGVGEYDSTALACSIDLVGLDRPVETESIDKILIITPS